MRIHPSLAFWPLAALVSQQPPLPAPISPAPGTRLQTRWAARVNPDRVMYAHQNRGGQFIDMSIVDVMEPGAAR